MSGVPVIQDVGTSAFTYFLGGFLLLIGARLAGGCPSGHGTNGMQLYDR